MTLLQRETEQQEISPTTEQLWSCVFVSTVQITSDKTTKI